MRSSKCSSREFSLTSNAEEPCGREININTAPHSSQYSASDGLAFLQRWQKIIECSVSWPVVRNRRRSRKTAAQTNERQMTTNRVYLFNGYRSIASATALPPPRH